MDTRSTTSTATVSKVRRTRDRWRLWHSPTARPKAINLALQGGGAHGAFTWGVLDRLLEDERIVFDGISATSAGAINAAALASGLATGGREGAKQALADLWRRISAAASRGPLQPTLFDQLTANYALDVSPPFVLFDLVMRLFSPYQLNPFDYNPLRQILMETVDFRALRRGRCPIKLFLSATDVRSGKIRIFVNGEMGPEAVLASCCLPSLFHAIEIDGEHYWDGGYVGNPAIFPLIYNCDSRDIVVVHINPLKRPDLPRTAHEILNRINEISFNSSLMREMRAIAFITELIDQDKINDSAVKRVLIHGIIADEVMRPFSFASRLNAGWDQLMHLNRLGREHAEAWLGQSYDKLGRESSVDLGGL